MASLIKIIDKKRIRGESYRRKAFTLAEVLITLGIIGIVAEITIPTLMQQFVEQATISQLQKSYSEFSQAYTMAVQDNGTPDQWGLVGMGDATGLANLNTIMSKYLKVAKNCGIGTGCFPDVTYKDLNNTTITGTTNYNQSNGGTKLVLADGTLIYLRQWMADCSWNWGTTPSMQNICGMFDMDINGFKGPNQEGVDLFMFLFTKTRIVPSGTQDQTGYPFSNFCNLSKTTTASWANGSSCAAWVLYNRNMDYRRCSGLDWSGPTKCP